ncbi:DUF3817 domain-containing protein [Brachybacterium sillae]|uniref:DUF3817 domain-containing protein n=1 Tax=Brachybacterium sillae TaxID=2810536 RepID=UPI00217E2AB1|nr:DUF3817 domain-containing protein [Brachybacterium sillae]
MLTPRRLYRTLALAEVVTWTLLLLGMVAKYVLHLGELGVRVGGGIHGVVFLAYCLATVLVGVDARWGAGRVLLGLVSAVVPYATVPFERHVEGRGLLPDTWRLRGTHSAATDTTARTPQGVLDRAVALFLRRPVPALIASVVAIAVMFSLLLLAGPPTQWGR